MARPLRNERPGGRYHVTARGNERRHIFRDDTDRFHFLELLAEMGERFGKLREKGCMHMHSIYTVLLTATIKCSL